MKMNSNILSGHIPLSDSRTSWNIGHESSVNFIKYEVILLGYTHRKKLLLNRFDTFEEAKEFADMISNYIKKPLVKYSPKRISKTK